VSAASAAASTGARPARPDGLPRWQVIGYLGVVAALLIGFASSSFEPFQQSVLGSTSVEVSPSTWKLQAGNLLPGASATAAFTVRNPGTGPVRISLVISSSTRTGRNLGAVLYLVLKTAGRSCDRFDGRVLARGAVGGFSLGYAAPGHQAGDLVLGPGSSQTFCLRALVPVNIGNEFQGASTVLRLTATAEGIAER
jgi:hypothetical protein